MAWNSTAVRRIRDALIVRPKERSIIIGSILGDGALVETAAGGSYRLQIDHGSAQRAYLWWKYEQLQRWTLSPPRYQPSTHSWRFRTLSHPLFTELARRFYPNGRKRVPVDIAVDLNDPLAVAIWFMDDGCRYSQGSLVINTQCFSRTDQKILQRALRMRCGVTATLQRDRERYRLYIPVADAKRFTAYIESYVREELRYKIERSRRDSGPTLRRIAMAGARQYEPT